MGSRQLHRQPRGCHIDLEVTTWDFPSIGHVDPQVCAGGTLFHSLARRGRSTRTRLTRPGRLRVFVLGYSGLRSRHIGAEAAQRRAATAAQRQHRNVIRAD